MDKWHDLLISTIGLWRLWPLALAIGIGLGIGKAMDLLGQHDRLPSRMRRTWERVDARPRPRQPID